MPSAVVHLRVAYDLAERLGVVNLGQFYAGAVSPDAVNIDGFAAQSVRYPAHLRSLDYEEWKNTVRTFAKEHSAEWADDTDFFKGFLLHIFTDIYWDELAQPEMFEKLKAAGVSDDEIRDAKWQELYRFNNKLAGEWLYDEVFPAIRKATPKPIGTVDTGRLSRYLTHLVDEYMQSVKAIDGEPIVCSFSMVENVEKASLDELRSLFS